jgi:hypothetical protein
LGYRWVEDFWSVEGGHTARAIWGGGHRATVMVVVFWRGVYGYEGVYGAIP